MVSFSIVICTYNPQPEIFQRLLTALLQFDLLSTEHEVIIVDNHSIPSLEKNDDVQSFLRLKKNARCIIQKEPGLTAARIAGIKKAINAWIVFFDDDNEPAADYLEKVVGVIQQFPKVGTWGPGTIEVEYIGQSSLWLETKKELFQHKQEINTSFEKQIFWQSCYPFGTGMIIKKEIAIIYADRVINGQYTLSDRKGKNLASGGDVQLVLTAIDLGFGAGIIAGLSLHHLIDASKANLSYMVKQQYGTASAYIKAVNQVFVHNRIKSGPVNNMDVLKKIYSLCRIHLLKMNRKDFQLLVATKLGELNASVFAEDKAKPFLLKLYEKLIHV